MKNIRAHVDPICIIPVTIGLILGGLVTATLYGGGTPASYLVIAFAGTILVSQIVHLFHHGINPISGIIGLVVFIMSMLLIRATLGTAGGLGEFYLNNLIYLAPSLMVLDLVKTLVS